MKKELIQLYNIDANKVTVIYPHVNTQRFSIISNEERNRIRKKFRFGENEIIYLFPSTGHKRKGIKLLKEYFDKNTKQPIKLVVAGTPINETENIKYLGFCKNMPELYQASDFTIMGSNYESFGLVGIESILCGTPVILAENMGCLEVLRNNFGYTFSKENYQSLDNAISLSIERFNEKHRILNPLECLSYNPDLNSHAAALIEEVKNRINIE